MTAVAGNHEDVVSFICSGTMMTFPATDIMAIEIGRSGQFCDPATSGSPITGCLGEQR